MMEVGETIAETARRETKEKHTYPPHSFIQLYMKICYMLCSCSQTRIVVTPRFPQR
ncbi:hypothetical protein [Reticulibacter mediterranei]|uniref:hypothetical protein n=1 Tax=Reticulibacter mediterranei TaxID=2778369 RepID=UPI003570D07A